MEDEGMDEEKQDQRTLDENDISLYNRLVLSNFLLFSKTIVITNYY